MAELNEGSNETSKSKKIRSAKLTSRVDLTAMVDLAFLLITFFMLTTSLSQPKSMDLVMPEADGVPSPIDENRTMTILLGDNNEVQYYMGKLSDQKPSKTTFGRNGLRQELALRKKEVLAYSTKNGKPEQGLIVLIKPGKKSNYGNLVDALDEMAISNIQTFAIVDVDAADDVLLDKNLSGSR